MSCTMRPSDRPRVTLSLSANLLREEGDRDSIRRIADVSDVMMGWYGVWLCWDSHRAVPRTIT